MTFASTSVLVHSEDTLLTLPAVLQLHTPPSPLGTTTLMAVLCIFRAVGWPDEESMLELGRNGHTRSDKLQTMSSEVSRTAPPGTVLPPQATRYAGST